MMLVDRVALMVGGRPIFWYGIMVAIGFLAGYSVMTWRARKVQFPVERVGDLLMAAIIGGITGARLWYVAMNWHDYQHQLWRIVRIDEGGLVFYGGFFGAALAMIWWSRRFRLSIPVVADLSAVALPMGHAFGRVGCLMNGCCFGRPTTLPFGIIYDREGFPGVWDTQVQQGLIHGGNVSSLMDPITNHVHCLPVFPVQAALGLGNLLVAGVLLGVAPRLRTPGRLFTLFLVLYPLNRFCWEFLRGDYPSRPGGLTPAQWVSLVVLPVGLIWFIALGRRAAATVSSPSPFPAKDAASETKPAHDQTR